jgi:hypothetical protein
VVKRLLPIPPRQLARQILVLRVIDDLSQSASPTTHITQ